MKTETPLSKKDRHEIYKKALELLPFRDAKAMYKYSLCYVIWKSDAELNLKPRNWYASCLTEKYMPEFKSFDTGDRYSGRIDGSYEETNYWFDPYDIKPRIKILKKCIKMTKET